MIKDKACDTSSSEHSVNASLLASQLVEYRRLDVVLQLAHYFYQI
jgi:hypothetical protein